MLLVCFPTAEMLFRQTSRGALRASQKDDFWWGEEALLPIIKAHQNNQTCRWLKKLCSPGFEVCASAAAEH